MFKVNDYIRYGLTGVCQVIDITTESNAAEGEIQYYVLNPVYQDNLTIRVPVRNESVMRSLATPDEVAALIAGMPGKETTWIEDMRQRKEFYKSVLRSGDNEEIVQMIKTLYVEREARLSIGKKLPLTDENMMIEAERQLYQEIALVVGISPDEVAAYINENVPED